MKEFTPADYTTIRGKKYLYSSVKMQFQCAYCLFVQVFTAVRNDDGLVIGLTIIPEGGLHAEDCKQAGDVTLDTQKVNEQ